MGKTPPEDKYPKDYFVPNFGPDRDIVGTQKHMQDTEAKIHHHWDPVANWAAAKAAKYPKDYGVPNFGLDKEMSTSLKNLKSQEAIHGTWNVL